MKVEEAKKELAEARRLLAEKKQKEEDEYKLLLERNEKHAEEIFPAECAKIEEEIIQACRNNRTRITFVPNSYNYQKHIDKLKEDGFIAVTRYSEPEKSINLDDWPDKEGYHYLEIEWE